MTVETVESKDSGSVVNNLPSSAEDTGSIP